MPSLTRIAAALAVAAVATVAGLPALSHAAIVSASFTALGGNDWRVAFTVTNDGTPATIPGLTVFFDAALFGNLSNAVAPAGWDPLLIAADPGLPAEGFYDALVLGDADALLPGQSLGGFGLDFSYLGSGAPGALPFELYALDAGGNFTLLFEGQTITAAVPEPGSAWLLAAALGGLVLTRRRAGSAA